MVMGPLRLGVLVVVLCSTLCWCWDSGLLPFLNFFERTLMVFLEFHCPLLVGDVGVFCCGGVCTFGGIPSRWKGLFWCLWFVGGGS